MQTHVDRDAGIATFRRGRSCCVRLGGTLDAPMARGVERQLLQDHGSVRLRLECSSLNAATPDAGRILASALLVWAQRRDDRSIDILNLDPDLHHALAWHPLRAFTDPDELLFYDPSREAPWSDSRAESRH